MTKEIDFSLAPSLHQAKSKNEAADLIFDFMRRHGQSFYDESVTQLEHGLQAADLARSSHADQNQVIAALLHDIGHFLMDECSDQSGFLEEDWFHETIGAVHLEPFFDSSVTEPIRLHVPAKRYLCTVDSKYYDGLSVASKQSYKLQGGKMSDEEVEAFQAHPEFETAVLLRRWDDGAKVKDKPVPDLDEYRQDLIACLRLNPES